ncbi:hypothetical protein LINPERPRIM_LOCUS23435 [Linum perenne]
MAITSVLTLVLLIISVTTVFGGTKQGCGETGPVATGPCYGYYSYCIKQLMTKLLQSAPETGTGYTTTQYYPANSPSGGLTGEAICVLGNYASCWDCLLTLKARLIYSCSQYQSGYYSSQYCSLSFNQLQ